MAVWADEDQAFRHDGGGAVEVMVAEAVQGHRDSEFGGESGRMCVNRQAGCSRLQFFV